MVTTNGQRKRPNARSRPHWSYSQLHQWMRCPLQYAFERIIKLPRPFIPSGLLFGSAVHEALAEYHSQLRNQLPLRPDAIREQFLLTWKTKEDEQPVRFGKHETRENLLDQGVALLDRYLEEPPPKQIVGIEEEMVVPLYTSRGELLDAPMIAVLDLMCRNENGLTVVEFKTSKRKYGDAELEMALQATCYVNAVQERYGEPVSLNYVVLVKTKSPQVQRLTTERSEADLGRLGDTVQAVQKAIEAEAFYPIESPMNCSGCPYRGPCKEWQGEVGKRTPCNNDREEERCWSS